MNQPSVIKSAEKNARQKSQLDDQFDNNWLAQTRKDIAADLIGVLAVDENSHPDLLYGVKAFLPSARACVVLGMEYASETMNLIKHPAKYSGAVKTGDLLAPHVNQLTIEIDQANSKLVKILRELGYRSLALCARGGGCRHGYHRHTQSAYHAGIRHPNPPRLSADRSATEDHSSYGSSG
jgi:hypothetical protein